VLSAREGLDDEHRRAAVSAHEGRPGAAVIGALGSPRLKLHRLRCQCRAARSSWATASWQRTTAKKQTSWWASTALNIVDLVPTLGSGTRVAPRLTAERP